MKSSTWSQRGQIQPALAAALGVVAVVGIVAAVVLIRPESGVPAGGDRPSTSPSASPSAAPSVTPTVVPTATPSGPSAPSSIDLRDATGHHVTLKIHDRAGSVVGVVSATPGDGMSVRWHDATVRTVDARTVEITWAGLPKDDIVDLSVSADHGGVSLTMVQSGPVPNSDAMGTDRIVLLTFDRPVQAAEIDVEVLDRTVD